jgi:two-component system response regulator GlrR
MDRALVETQKQILIVDDDPHILFVWRAALARLSYPCSVETATNGLEALAILKERAFDLIVTDLRMAVMDGHELTEAVRGMDERIPVIWITAHRLPCTAVHAEQLAVYRCLDKPVSVAQMRQVVCEALDVAVGSLPAGPT